MIFLDFLFKVMLIANFGIQVDFKHDFPYKATTFANFSLNVDLK